MSSPLAVALATSWALAAPSYSQALFGADAPPDPARGAETFLIIARPEASDIYVPPKVRIGGAEILQRNPSLLRTNEKDAAYDLPTAVQLTWNLLHRDEASTGSIEEPPFTGAAPEPTASILLACSPLLLLRRRRTNPFGGNRSSNEGDRSSPADAANQETP